MGYIFCSETPCSLGALNYLPYVHQSVPDDHVVFVGSPADLTLELKDTKKKSSSNVHMGCILIQCTLTCKSSFDYTKQVSLHV